MKEPTTPFAIGVQETFGITRDFLESQGWLLQEEYPLYETYEHTKNRSLRCSIGLYGSFSIVELHWCNQTPEREFSANNRNLTKDDYFTILKLLNINTPCKQTH